MLGIHLHLAIPCNTCDGNAGNDDSHEDGCPSARLKKLLHDPERYRFGCPVCPSRGNPVELDLNDLWQCRKCRTRFTASRLAEGEDPRSLRESVLLDENNNRVVDVLQLTKKGSGKFRVDAEIEALKKEIRRVRKARKKST